MLIAGISANLQAYAHFHVIIGIRPHICINEREIKGTKYSLKSIRCGSPWYGVCVCVAVCIGNVYCISMRVNSRKPRKKGSSHPNNRYTYNSMRTANMLLERSSMYACIFPIDKNKRCLERITHAFVVLYPFGHNFAVVIVR